MLQAGCRVSADSDRSYPKLEVSRFNPTTIPIRVRVGRSLPEAAVTIPRLSPGESGVLTRGDRDRYGPASVPVAAPGRAARLVAGESTLGRFVLTYAELESEELSASPLTDNAPYLRRAPRRDPHSALHHGIPGYPGISLGLAGGLTRRRSRARSRGALAGAFACEALGRPRVLRPDPCLTFPTTPTISPSCTCPCWSTGASGPRSSPRGAWPWP